MTTAEKLERLRAFDLFYDDDDDEDSPSEREVWARTLNVSDTFMWGCADGETLTDEEIDEAYRLFRLYGWCGLVYLVVKKRGHLDKPSEFKDICRKVQFVRAEEDARASCESDTQYAYKQIGYLVGQYPAAVSGHPYP